MERTTKAEVEFWFHQLAEALGKSTVPYGHEQTVTT